MHGRNAFKSRRAHLAFLSIAGVELCLHSTQTSSNRPIAVDLSNMDESKLEDLAAKVTEVQTIASTGTYKDVGKNTNSF